MSFLMFLWRVRFGYPRVGVAIINGRMEGCFSIVNIIAIFINLRSNYAWDLGALNSNMMSYSHYGTRNTDFEVFQKTVILPMDGKVVTVVREVHFLINCGNAKVSTQLR